MRAHIILLTDNAVNEAVEYKHSKYTRHGNVFAFCVDWGLVNNSMLCCAGCQITTLLMNT